MIIVKSNVVTISMIKSIAKLLCIVRSLGIAWCTVKIEFSVSNYQIIIILFNKDNIDALQGSSFVCFLDLLCVLSGTEIMTWQ